MTRRFDRIVYSHPAGRDGFDFLYIAYTPGQRGLDLRFRRTSREPQTVHMSADDLLAFLATKRHEQSDDWPLAVTDPASRILKDQVRRWRMRMEDARR